MRNSGHIELQQALYRSSQWLPVTVMCIGLFVLVGWGFEIGFLVSPLQGLAAMNPVTAIGLILSSVAFLLVTETKKPSLTTKAKWISWLVVLIGVVKMIDTIPGINIPIDRLLFTKKVDTIPGHMAMNTAICLVLSGVALLLMPLIQSRKKFYSQYLALLIASVSFLSILLYLYRVPDFYTVLRYVPMSIHTAISFFLLSLSFLFVYPDRGIMIEFTGPYIGSFVARILVPVAIIVPVLLGFFRLIAHWAGLFTTEMGVAVLVLSIIIVFLSMIRYSTSILNRKDQQREAAELALQKNRDRIEELFNASPDAAVIADEHGFIRMINNQAVELFGFSKKELVGLPAEVLVPDKRKPVYREYRSYYLSNLVNQPMQTNLKIEGVKKDGSTFPAELSLSPLHTDEGLMVTASIRDITERKKLEQQVRQLAILVEQTNDAILSTDTDFKIRNWNRGAEILYGYTEEEAVGVPANTLIKVNMAPDQRETILKKIAEQGYYYDEFEVTTAKKGTLNILISVTALRRKSGKITGYVAVHRDITERKKMELRLKQFNEELEKQVALKTAEIRQSEEKFKTLIERISDGFLSLDKNWCYTYANKQIGKLVHRDPSSLIGKNIWEEFPSAVGSDTYKAFVKAMNDQQMVINTDYYQPLELWQENHVYPSEDGISVFIRDITIKKKAEQDMLRVNDELRRLTVYLESVREEERIHIAREIHDELGQQLTGLKMYVHNLGKNWNDPAANNDDTINDIIDLTDEIVKSVRRISSNLRPPILDDLGLVAALEWHSQEVEKRSDMSVEFKTDLFNLDLPANISTGLFRIYQEALNNAMKHSEAQKITSKIELAEDWLLLEIVDDGKGVNTEEIKEKKTFGLLGIQERTHMMNGKFTFDSLPGKGTRITIAVPLAEIIN